MPRMGPLAIVIRIIFMLLATGVAAVACTTVQDSGRSCGHPADPGYGACAQGRQLQATQATALATASVTLALLGVAAAVGVARPLNRHPGGPAPAPGAAPVPAYPPPYPNPNPYGGQPYPGPPYP